MRLMVFDQLDLNYVRILEEYIGSYNLAHETKYKPVELLSEAYGGALKLHD